MIWPCQQMVYAQLNNCPRKWHSQTPVGLWYSNGSPNLGQKTRPYNDQQQQQKKNLQNCRQKQQTTEQN